MHLENDQRVFGNPLTDLCYIFAKRANTFWGIGHKVANTLGFPITSLL
jgi:hypothetical protein